MKILDYLRVLLPDYWFSNNRYSQVWDAKLRKLMKDHKFTDIDEFTAKINGIKIWTANHPYASFAARNSKFRPSRVTILRAHRKLLHDFEETL